MQYAHSSVLARPVRLALLSDLELLDSPTEAIFDRLTRLAVASLNVPIALITFIDTDRQFIKSSVGLPDPWGTLRSMPLSYSFCQYVVISGEPVIIPDTRAVSFVHQHPAMLDLQFLAYAGFPLKTTDGEVLGAFSVIDHRSHVWTSTEIDHLHDLTNLAISEIDRRQVTASYEKQHLAVVAMAQRQAQESDLLNRVRTALAREVDLSNIIRTVVEGIGETFGYTQVSLYLIQGDALVLQHQIGYDQVIDRVPLTRGVSGRVARTGIPVLIEDVRTDPAFLGAIEGIVSEVCVPVLDHDNVVGILNVESTGDLALTNADLRLMLALSDQLTIALGRARLYRELRERKEHFATIFRASPVTITITDRLTGQYRDVNQRFLEIMEYARTEVIGRTSLDLNIWVNLEDRVRIGQELERYQSAHAMEIPFRTKTGKILETLASFELIELNGAECIISLTQDITQRKQMETERDRLIGELTNALANIRTLQGLIPICAACKKIRDDDGFWNQLEEYIQKHSNAQFSHGICPDCMQRLYPDLQ